MKRCKKFWMLIAFTCAYSTTSTYAEDITNSLQDETNKFNAQTARDKAEAEAIAAAGALAKAKSERARLDQVIEAEDIASDLALAKAKASLEAEKYINYKEVFGDAPNVGKTGDIQISDTTTGQLLQIKSGSLKVTEKLARDLCSRLEQAGVVKAFIAPDGLELKIQASQLYINEIKLLSRQVDAEREFIEGELTAQITGMEIVAGLTIARYGLDAAVQLLRLLRTDISAGLSSTDRERLLIDFTSAICPEQLPIAEIEKSVRVGKIDDTLEQINELILFSDRVDALTAALTSEIAILKQRLGDTKDTEKPNLADIESLKEQIYIKEAALSKVSMLSPLVLRIKSIGQAISSKPQEFLDAVTWYAFSQEDLASSPRLLISLTTQDAQIVKDNYFLGKRIYGLSSGELIYTVKSPDGFVITTGYVVSTDTQGKINLDSEKAINSQGTGSTKVRASQK
ncbi:hypothetical protein I5L51_21050 [Pseudomonas mendocina]|nr:hypothetical protein [Pseudomonas mendocina]MBH3341603.1 hypothetical protein [Pseudomonas mendocina]